MLQFKFSFTACQLTL